MKEQKCAGDWDYAMDEQAKLAIKVGIEQMIKGKGYTWEEVMEHVNQILRT